MSSSSELIVVFMSNSLMSLPTSDITQPLTWAGSTRKAVSIFVPSCHAWEGETVMALSVSNETLKGVIIEVALVETS